VLPRDVLAALEELKEQVFREGLYERPMDFDREEMKHAIDFLTEQYKDLPAPARVQTDLFLSMARSTMKQTKPKRRAGTIKELLQQCGESGTHSILDIDRISDVRDFGAVVPLSSAQVVELFATDQPTHEMLERWSQRVDPLGAEPLYDRWEGIYIIVYKDGQPDEIYFEGCSGD
jgi:hypothetical protein